MRLVLDKEKRPQPEAAATVNDDIFQSEQHRGVRLVLDQLHTFFTACELMDLPFDNPFVFFVKLDDVLHHPDKFRLDGKPADLNEHRFLPMGVLLLYACYGNDLFALSDAARDAHFSTLWQQPSLRYIEEELDRLGIKQTICRLVARTERRDIYRLYPELIQFNENNTCFSLSNGTLPLQDVACSVEMPDVFVRDLYHLFLSYYEAVHGKACSISANAKLPEAAQEIMVYMEGLLKLRALERDASKEIVKDVDKLSEHVEKLLSLAETYQCLLYSMPCCSVLSYSELGKFYVQAYGDEPNYSDRLRSKKAQYTALANLANVISPFPKKQFDGLVERLYQLLHSYADNPVFLFFDTAYKQMAVFPASRRIAPAYFWRLFVQHADPIYKQKTYLVSDSTKAADFSLKPFVQEGFPDMQSAERKSNSRVERQCRLYEELVKYFEENGKTVIPGVDMAEEIEPSISLHYLQKHLLANFDIYTDTGITGATLSNEVPLYRLFRPLYDALTSMDGELWEQMPYSASSSATIEQADKFYCKERSDTDALKFLRESAGQPPIERKKNLTLKQCWSFVDAALIAKDGSLTERIITYIAEHKELSEYAEQSEEKRKILHWTIYRMALERCAYSLSRSLMKEFMQISDKWSGEQDLENLWTVFFEEHKETFIWNTIADKIRFGPVQIYGRILGQIDLPAAQLPAPQEVARDCGMVLLGGENADSHAAYIAELEQNHVLAMYRLKTLDKDWSEESTKAALLAQQSGFSGTVLPAYTLYKELVQDTDDAESIHLKLWAQYHMQYMAAIRGIGVECGNDFAIIGEVDCRDSEPVTLNALNVISFWLVQDGADAVIVRYDGSLTEQVVNHIAALAGRLAVPLFLQSETMTFEQKCNLLAETAIFGYAQPLPIS